MFYPTEIYLDGNATSPVLPRAQVAVVEAMERFYGNPSSTHTSGLQARALVERVRQQARQVLGALDGSLIFVSGATEAIHTAVLSALCALRERRDRGESVGRLLVYGATEHKAVPAALAHWNQLLGLGFDLQPLPVHADGRHDLDRLSSYLPDLGLLCTMAANNETGVVSDLAAIESLLNGAECRALWLVDGVQALGKLALRLTGTRIDYAAFSGHKLYAPKGIGLLYVREGAPFTPLMTGGGQEGGQRAGTENVPGIAGLGAVLQHCLETDISDNHTRLHDLRGCLATCLKEAFPGLVLNSPESGGLPTTLNFSVPGWSSKQVLNLLDAAGVRVSTGSACSSAKATPSEVLQAMGLPGWRTEAAVRLSFGPWTPAIDIQRACARIAQCSAVIKAAPERASGLNAVDIPESVAAGEPARDEWPEMSDRALSFQAMNALRVQYRDLVLVDVRERHEHLVSAWSHGSGLEVLNLPLSQLNVQLANWLSAERRPIVFFCRSGARSLQALQAFRRAGRDRVWHLAGGLSAAQAGT
jgi:cysteine sulfinate desulfinase/cysteine desulfurase-like protein/rhodanese-related sulfurtransferase